MMETFKVFAEKSLSEYLRSRTAEIQVEIERYSGDYILNVNELEFIDYLEGKFTVGQVDLLFDGVTITDAEREFSRDRTSFYGGYEARPPVKKTAITYHIPYVGNTELLEMAPSSRLLWSTFVRLEDGCLCFDVISYDDNNPNEVSREATSVLGNLNQQLANVMTEVGSHNVQIRSRVERAFRLRKEQLLKKSQLVASLGVPLRKRDGLPMTFSVSFPQPRKVILPKPVVKEIGYRPEPTIDASVYFDILKTIDDVGKVFERLPSTYGGKDEEALRDHTLLYLEPRFEGAATGETFNKSGKTDILVRYENTNVFIAECKFWGGQKLYLETVTQLLGYLTWRDSKAAVILFVKNKDFSAVLQTVQEVSSTHPNYLGNHPKTHDSWFNYRFHTNGDRNREVHLAVLLFHIPEP